MDSVQFVGFGVSGFRGIRGESHLLLREGTTFLAGPNNSGKSTLMQAVQRFLPPLIGWSSGGDAQFLDLADPFDTPLRDGLPDPSSLPFSLAMGLQLHGDRAAAWASLVRGEPTNTRDEDDRRAIDAYLVMAHAGPGEDEGVVWIWMEGRRDAQGQIQAVIPDRRLSPSWSPSEYVNAMGNAGVHGQMDPNTFVRSALRNVSGYPSEVRTIPGMRRASASGTRAIQAQQMDGSDAVSTLLALQSPTPSEYRSALKQREIVYQFVKDVTGDEEAELLVSHDANTLSIALRGEMLPITNLGSGLEQLIILSVLLTAGSDAVICVEEPEVFLHPSLQRVLLRHISEIRGTRFLIATHSPTLIDSQVGQVYSVRSQEPLGITVEQVDDDGRAADLAMELGYRASDLLQANAVIWVEGPSDRTYIGAWLRAVEPRLVEGVHYAFIIYGGGLAAELSADDEDSEALASRSVPLFRINRNAVLVVDSDRSEPAVDLAEGKQRLVDEFAEGTQGRSYIWITDGYTIENYLDVPAFHAAYSEVHPRGGTKLTYQGDLSNPFVGGVQRPAKTRIADAYVRQHSEVPTHLKPLGDHLTNVLKVLLNANEGLLTPGGLPVPTHESSGAVPTRPSD